MNKKRSKLYLVVFVALVLVAGVSMIQGALAPHFVKRTREAELRSFLMALQDGETWCFSSFERYCDSMDKLGFVGESPGEIYFAADNLPGAYKNTVNPEDLPRCTDKTYSILMVVQNKAEHRSEFWKIDNTHPPTQLPYTIPAEP